MSLASDYFLLYHGLSLPEQESFVIDEGLDDEFLFESSALVLSLERKNFEKAAGLSSFAILCDRLSNQTISHLQELYRLQQTLIPHILLRKSEKNLTHLHRSFRYLSDEGVIREEACKKLISLFDPVVLKSGDENALIVEQRREGFKVQRHELLVALNQLRALFHTTEDLDETAGYLSAQKFSVGITGVMNAGKSTMLNALLGKEVLGTNVVPETANLSIIRYGAKPSAKVIYWNRSEWARIEQSAEEIKSMAGFVNETHVHFRQDLDEYIREESRVDKIDINALGAYTSASDESKRCNLVKQVELECELHFLNEGIEIVDTPGLDDVVIQREEITKQYIATCDLMIHLMNVSQSASAKDIEFIVDALIYQNVTKVLVVITRIDTVSEEDVNEVIAYTKKSLVARLHAVNEDAKLDLVLKGLHFIALSGKMALLHKTGRSKEAIDAGYDLEKSGIVKVETFLERTLFSKDNERSSLVIRSARKRLQRAVESELEHLHLELASLSKSETELKAELKVIRQKKARESKRLDGLKEQVSAYKDELDVYVKTQGSILEQDLKSLQSIIRQRLLDDVRYSLEKDKKIPRTSRIKDIVEKALRYGLTDAVRDYYHRLRIKTDKIESALYKQYPELFDTFIHDEHSFESDFDKGFLVSNNEVLVSRLCRLLAKSSLKTLLEDDKQMAEIIKEEFMNLQELIVTRAHDVSILLVDRLMSGLDHSIEVLLNKLETDETLLQASLLSIDEDEALRTQRSLDVHKKAKMIELIARRCQV